MGFGPWAVRWNEFLPLGEMLSGPRLAKPYSVARVRRNLGPLNVTLRIAPTRLPGTRR